MAEIINIDPMEEQLDEIFGDNQKIGASENTRNILEAAVPLGLVRRTGAMVMAKRSGESANVLGHTLPVIGSPFDQYERIL